MVANKKNNKNIQTKKRTVKKVNLMTETMMEVDGFPVFSSERDRLKYMRDNYSRMSIDKAFSMYYETELTKKQKKVLNSTNNIIQLAKGMIVTATVTKFNKEGLEFVIPGVKEEIISKENLLQYKENIDEYLMTHKNKLSIEVREFVHGRWVVSVMNAYYRLWLNSIERAIKNESGIQVHINELTKGGYICSTPVTHLQELTGKPFTCNCFLPGSQIVLNIEHDFEQWVGQDVIVCPQKFGKFRKEVGSPMEDSIICSRKRALQITGMVNLYNLYNTYQLHQKFNNSEQAVQKDIELDCVVTGIINSNNKTGVFFEVKDQQITGMLPCTEDELINYIPGTEYKLILDKFDMQEGKPEPFLIINNQIKKCFIRPVFRIA